MTHFYKYITYFWQFYKYIYIYNMYVKVHKIRKTCYVILERQKVEWHWKVWGTLRRFQ